MEKHYWLAGEVNIPENKKPEFNAYVMEILNLCGIRKQKNITLAGKTVTVLDKPQPDQEGLAVEEYLADILLDVEKEWLCRYVDHDFVKNMLDNKEDPMWRRALLVLRKVVDDGLECFPELDHSGAIRWIKTYRSTFDINEISVYCSLMVNAHQRQRIFRF